MLNVVTIINITQTLLSASQQDLIFPWSINSSLEAGVDIWSVQIIIPKGSNPYQTFITWYNSLCSAIEQAPYPGLILIEPRLSLVIPISSGGIPGFTVNYFLSFELRTLEGARPTIWNAPNLLVLENPITSAECMDKVREIYSNIERHALFGLTNDAVLKTSSNIASTSEDNPDTDLSENLPLTNSNRTSSCKKASKSRSNFEDYEQKLLSFLNTKENPCEYDEDINFSQMIVPMLRKLNDDQKHFAKVEIMNILQKAKSSIHSKHQFVIKTKITFVIHANVVSAIILYIFPFSTSNHADNATSTTTCVRTCKTNHVFAT
ncbi:hypothetical protein K1T71_011634 [Dendrolimus kikuchii]|uniref:Uncharacterized protein n=1 Tax=Dendrolimus kikuchii TaxID=765133 RepID=A0ACC1CLW9_9NEOP|nr:hypothetical protein K1T71_011634 [Dendrolimus kikuchii]